MMRFCFAIPVLAAGLVFLTRPLPAQLNGFTQAGNSGSRIGVGLRDIDAERARELKLGSVTGVEVVVVESGSPAEQAGIKAGDILLSYNSESIMGAQQLGRMVSETPIGRKVKIEYWRDGKITTVSATTSARQTSVIAFPHDFPNLNGPSDLFMPGSFPTARFVWTTPRFGIESEALDSRDWQLAEFFGVRHGVLVRAVAKDSPAAKAGLRAGDVVTQIGDRAVGDPKDIASYLRQEQHLVKPFAVEVMREHKAATLKVSVNADGQQ